MPGLSPPLRFRAAAEVRNIPTERPPVAMLGSGVGRARVRSAFFYREDVLTLSGEGGLPRDRVPASLQEVMFRRALLIMTVVFAGAACEELPEPKTPCRTEQECRDQAKLCHYSCAHPRALKTCTKCCLDMERKCISCEEKYEFNSCD